VIVFTLPAEVNETGAEAGRYVKRVIGLPGETIQLTSEGLIVNGARVEVPALLADRFSSFRSFDGHRFGAEPYEIPSDSVFLIGDNPRIYVSDSREFGPIPIRNIESRVLASVRTDPIT
jgi:signal peptidase I